MPPEIPSQEDTLHFITSFRLKREYELRDLYDLPPQELDILQAEMQVVVDDPETTRAKRLLASTFVNLAVLVRQQRITP